MCLADSRQQTTVVIVVAYTVPKRFIPGGAGAIPVPPGSNLSSVVPEWEWDELPEPVFRNYGLAIIIVSACCIDVTEVTRCARR